jgi:hypothetical protein
VELGPRDFRVVLGIDDMGLGGSCLAEQVGIERRPSSVHRQQTPINPEHPVITIASTQVTGNPEVLQVTGNLAIMGQVHLITVSGGVAGVVGVATMYPEPCVIHFGDWALTVEDGGLDDGYPLLCTAAAVHATWPRRGTPGHRANHLVAIAPPHHGNRTPGCVVRLPKSRSERGSRAVQAHSCLIRKQMS